MFNPWQGEGCRASPGSSPWPVVRCVAACACAHRAGVQSDFWRGKVLCGRCDALHASESVTTWLCTLLLIASPLHCCACCAQVWGVAFRPDGSRLASVSDDKSVCLFDFS